MGNIFTIDNFTFEAKGNADRLQEKWDGLIVASKLLGYEVNVEKNNRRIEVLLEKRWGDIRLTFFKFEFVKFRANDYLNYGIVECTQFKKRFYELSGLYHEMYDLMELL